MRAFVVLAAVSVVVVAAETALFASGGNVAPLGYLVWIGPGLAAGLPTARQLARRLEQPTDAVGAALLVAFASIAAPIALVVVLFAAGGGGH